MINARFSLPFCAAVEFPGLWGELIKSLKVGGIFCGQFFGPDDEFLLEAPPGSTVVSQRTIGPSAPMVGTGVPC